jgi:hypothetical protein
MLKFHFSTPEDTPAVFPSDNPENHGSDSGVENCRLTSAKTGLPNLKIGFFQIPASPVQALYDLFLYSFFMFPCLPCFRYSVFVLDKK